jgi:hypothetical protein
MRFPLAIGLSFLLASPALAATAPVAKPAPAPGRSAGFPLARATPEEVRAWLGEPVVANEEGKGAFWTYRLEACALMVFFKDEGQGLRVSGVAAGPRRRADAPPDPDECIASARKP